MTSPSATLYCLPPVLTIAYIVDAPSCLLWSRCCPVSVDFFSCLSCGQALLRRRQGAPTPAAVRTPGSPRGVSAVRCRWRPRRTPLETSRRQSIRTHQTPECWTKRTRAPQSPLRSSVPTAYSTRPRQAGQTSAGPTTDRPGLTQPGRDARTAVNSTAARPGRTRSAVRQLRHPRPGRRAGTRPGGGAAATARHGFGGRRTVTGRLVRVAVGGCRGRSSPFPLAE